MSCGPHSRATTSPRAVSRFPHPRPSFRLAHRSLASRSNVSIWGQHEHSGSPLSLLAVVAAAIEFDAEPGLNWLLWTAPAALALCYYTLATRPAAVRDIAVPLALAVVISAGAAVTSSPALHFFIVVANVLLFAYASRIAAGVPAASAGALFIASAPLVGAFETAHESWDQVGELAESAKAERSMPVLRGTMLAVPVIILLWLLLAAADPHLSSWGGAIVDADPRAHVHPAPHLRRRDRRALARRVRSRVARGRHVGRPRLRAARARIPSPSGSSCSARSRRSSPPSSCCSCRQCSGIPRPSPGSGVTYAEWVHSGFAELTTAATIVTVLIVVLDTTAARGGAGQERAARALSLTLLALTAFVVLSAFRRIALYESAYGYTMPRLWAQTFMVCVWIALALTALEIARGLDARRLARRGAVVGAVALATLIYWNTGAFVVRENVARFADSGKLDVALSRVGTVDGRACHRSSLRARRCPPCWPTVSPTMLKERVSKRCELAPGAWYEYNARRWEAIRMAGAQQWPITYPGRHCQDQED